ncbi:M14 family metallopeptidase [Mongoliitalea daihaiensis]|uniref:M14 family metallopeptidase n=1 Tax=Mongoliitalea daihaiensis TaxID=2782006 RepID=UPI001F4010C6|nr:M14 family metallopeptidase [Mongoliitalea daihaiensis]UJP66317.1 peptidase M14 [Mongoliitalea daihaiensis]
MKLKNIVYTGLIGAALCFTGIQESTAQVAEGRYFRALGTPHNPKVPVSWNRYHTNLALEEIMKDMAKKHPNIVKLNSIGKSYQGNDIWVLTITDFSTGKAEDKPAMWIDGNIHSNEIQGTEFTLYTAWYLAEMYGDLDYITQLLKDKTFYIAPTINPDAHDYFIKEANNQNSPRSGMMIFDNDRDGEFGEDPFDDLNGDGHITMMIRKSPTGRFVKDKMDPRKLVMVGPDQQGEYEMLGYEGIDRDGDGVINDDGIGYYDPNRDWGWNWQPDYIQSGALRYPFSVPENRAVVDFVMKHPNIAAAQSYHNYGGMILRGPGAEEDLGTYNASDIRVYDAIAKKGEEFMPGYRYLVVYKDLYSVFGGQLDWFYGGRGIFTYSNELMTSYLYFHTNAGRNNQDEQFKADDYLLFGDAFVNWEAYNHPQYGEIEVGGFKKNFGRLHPGFLMETDAHRNAAFTILHAYHTPKLSVSDVKEKDLGGGLKEITATIYNERMIPTHSSQDLKYKIQRPDYISISGAKVVAGFVVENEDFNKLAEQKVNPEKISVANIPGMGAVKVRWIVSGNSNYSITVDSAKGGKASWKK